MTQIDFYILSESEPQARLAFALRLIDKAFRHGKRVFVACADQASAEALDEALWCDNPESFIPHALLSAGESAPVEIGCDSDCGDHHQVLVNLSNNRPDYFSRFERVLEIVIQADEVLKQTRDNWSFYKRRGYPVTPHKIAANGHH